VYSVLLFTGLYVLYENSRRSYSACMFFGLEENGCPPSPEISVDHIFTVHLFVVHFLRLVICKKFSLRPPHVNELSSCVLPFSFFVTRRTHAFVVKRLARVFLYAITLHARVLYVINDADRRPAVRYEIWSR